MIREKKAHAFDRADLEWYAEPPSVSDALFRVEKFDGEICDPCAGMGNIIHSAMNHGLPVMAMDLQPRHEFFKGTGRVCEQSDFLSGDADLTFFENIVMNPPYGPGEDGRLEEQFIAQAVRLAKGKVAALLRLNWFAARREFLVDKGLLRVLVLTPRPSILPGENIRAGEKPGGGTVEYAWFIFLRGYDGPASIGHAPRHPKLDMEANWTWRLNKAAR